ncbi:MAG: putative DNA binding domain-containing protein [Desulfobacterales bacterium]
MNADELMQIVQNGESSVVEFKTEEVHPNSLAEEIVAFANFEGGTVFIGVDDSGLITGCQRRDMEEFVINVCRNNVRPSLIPIIEKIAVDKKNVMAVRIPRGDTAYATSRGLYFIRIGSTKQTPTQIELLRLFQKRNILQYDESPVLKASANSIDIHKVNTYLKKMGQSSLNDEDEKALIHEFVNLSILTEMNEQYYPSLGGLLAFGKNPQKYFPSFTIMCGAYKGIDFLSETIREKELTGTLDELIEESLAFAKMTMEQKHVMDRGIQGRVEYAFSPEALREAIVNALCHRDYTITGSSVRFFVFQDRVEIRSPGGLPNTITLRNMCYRQFSRNQMIASFLSGYGYMERRGKGIQRMIRLSEQAGAECRISLSPDENEVLVVFQKPLE